MSRRGCGYGAGEGRLVPSARSCTTPTTPQSGPFALTAPLTQGSQAPRGDEGRRTGPSEGAKGLGSRLPAPAPSGQQKRRRPKTPLQLVEKGCGNAAFFLWDVFSRTCAGKKHRNSPIFRKKSVKPARRPELNCREKPSEAVFRQSQGGVRRRRPGNQDQLCALSAGTGGRRPAPRCSSA